VDGAPADGSKDVPENGYVAPLPFAPPAFRVAPLNETEILGRSTYPPAETTGWRPVPLPNRGRSPRARRRVTVGIAVAVVASLVAIGTTLSSGADSRQTRSLSLPDTVDTYSQVTHLDGAQVSSLFAAAGGTFGGIGSDDLRGAVVGIYADVGDSEPNLLFVGFTAADSPRLGARLRAGSPDSLATAVLDGTPALRVDPGPFGGAMRCANIDLDGELATVGVWTDQDTLGIVLIVAAPPATMPSTPAETASVTRDFRAAAEH
jgi:hypothetical protein